MNHLLFPTLVKSAHFYSGYSTEENTMVQHDTRTMKKKYLMLSKSLFDEECNTLEIVQTIFTI